MLVKERLPRQARFCSCSKCACSGNELPVSSAGNHTAACEKALGCRQFQTELLKINLTLKHSSLELEKKGTHHNELPTIPQF